MNLITNHVFVSRDVHLYEHIFPYKVFHKPNSPQGGTTDIVIKGHLDEECDVDYNTNEGDQPKERRSEVTDVPSVRRLSRTHLTPAWHKDYITSNCVSNPGPHKIHQTIQTTPISAFSCFLSQTLTTIAPKTFK